MNLIKLFKDELKGFYKSKVMIFLWLGLPLLALSIHLWQPETGEELPFTAVSAILVSSIGGTLASVMLAVSIINEKNSKVYDLFLIRPIKRRDILISKFLAIYLCIAIASLLALSLGLIIDYYTIGGTPETVLESAKDSIILSLSMMAISSSAGVLIGVLSPSILVGAILVIYGGNQISVIPLLPTILNISNKQLFTVGIGILFTVVLMGIAIMIFNRKQF